MNCMTEVEYSRFKAHKDYISHIIYFEGIDFKSLAWTGTSLCDILTGNSVKDYDLFCGSIVQFDNILKQLISKNMKVIRFGKSDELDIGYEAASPEFEKRKQRLTPMKEILLSGRAMTIRTLTGELIQFIKPLEEKTTVQNILKDFDFWHCCSYSYQDKFFASNRVMQTIRSRELVLNRTFKDFLQEKEEYPALNILNLSCVPEYNSEELRRVKQILLRTEKFVSRGFTIDESTAKILEDWRTKV